MNYFVADSAIIEENVKIGKGTRIWSHVQIRKDAEIGEGCNIGKGVYIDYGVKIGNRVKIQNYVSVYHGVEIGDDVFVGPSATFTNDKHPRAWLWNEERLCRTKVEDGASIGANATIVCGITLGKYCMIGAGSVVTRDVPPHALILGSPGKISGFVCECGERLDENFYCKKCKKSFPELRNYMNTQV